MIITATAVTIFAPDITVSAATIISFELIPIVQERICFITNNYFNSDDLSVQTTAIFNTTSRSIIIDQNSWEEFGFLSGDDVLIYNSYRNDGVVTIESMSGNQVILTSSCSVVNEAFNNNLGKIIYFSVIKWPKDVQHIAAEMVYFDCDIRPKNSPNVRSRSFGPFSESYTNDTNKFGYPTDIIGKLEKYTIVRLM